MSAKTGRNDPCPCGSGNKYKRCCLPKDEAARLVKTKVERPTAHASELTPEELASDALWERFERAPLDERLAIVHEAVGSPELDGDSAFDLCCELCSPLTKAGRLADLVALLDRIERERPELYAENAGYFTKWVAAATVRANAGGELEAVQRFAAHFTEAFDAAQHFVDYLRFHGRADLLESLLAPVWPEVRDDDDLMDGAKDSMAGLLTETIIARHRAQKSNLEADDDALIRDLAPLFDDDDDTGVANAVRPFVVRASRTWSGVDFRKTENLRDLLLDFSAFLESRAGFSALRAGMARASFEKWVVPAEGASTRGRGGQGTPPLSVTPRSVKELVRQHSNVVALFAHALAADLLALPHWTEFLIERGLAGRDAAEAAWRTFQGQLRGELGDALVQNLEGDDDPIAAAEVRALLARRT